MKAAPVWRAMRRHPAQFEQLLVHTGQHYDAQMSQVFFDELQLPRPQVNLEVGSGTHAWQTAQVMLRFEPVLREARPDWVFVYGDVNSTLACALVSAKQGVLVAHVEAGLRSGDRSLPEELNRLLTDQLADLLFTPSPDGDANLLREGIPPHKIHRVGNVMIDTLVQLLPKAQERWANLQSRLDLRQFMLVTLHRPFNVDDPATLIEIMTALEELAAGALTPFPCRVLFPMHPRTRHCLEELGWAPASDNLSLLEPFGYLDFLALQAHAALVLTDSGGVQEETTFLGIPCLTARPNTERPITLTQGTNQLVASSHAELVAALRQRLGNLAGPLPPSPEARPVIPLWDGHAAERIVQVLLNLRGANK
jgi:UDP-N-acetylglucosamine 2-epimerase (non-hydrolysing)